MTAATDLTSFYRWAAGTSPQLSDVLIRGHPQRDLPGSVFYDFCPCSSLSLTFRGSLVAAGRAGRGCAVVQLPLRSFCGAHRSRVGTRFRCGWLWFQLGTPSPPRGHRWSCSACSESAIAGDAGWVCWANWALGLNQGSQAGKKRKRGAGDVGMAGSEAICGFTGHPGIDRVAATQLAGGRDACGQAGGSPSCSQLLSSAREAPSRQPLWPGEVCPT